MVSATSKLRQIAQGEGLPEMVTTRSGAMFNPRGDVWKYRDGVHDVSLVWSRLDAYPPALIAGIKATMVWYAKNGSPTTLNLYLSAFEMWATVNPSPVLSERQYVRFRAEHYGKRIVGHAKAFIRKWHLLGIPGVSRDFINVLNSTKEKGRPTGVAVATMDPIMGPYTDVELQGIQGALTDAFEAGEVSERGHCLFWLFSATGARPVQLAALKVKDVHRRLVDGVFHYDIDVPRAKKKNQVRRAEFKNRPLTAQIGEAVYAFAQHVKKHFVELLVEAEEAPLFPQFEKRQSKWTAGLEYHNTPHTISQMLIRSLSGLRVLSERTGGPMKIRPIRFRRTLGTRAAQEGHGALVIAELLDHEDTQHVGVYVESRPEMAERIDKAVALELAPLAQAFKGKLVRSLSQATRAGDPSARIRDLRFGEKDEGYCGSAGSCGFNAPIACYTCHSYEPWLDGPHEAVLDFLLAKRDRQLANGDKRIATIHDRTILAVAEVVQLCREHLRIVTNE